MGRIVPEREPDRDREPLDEEAVWASLVASFNGEPGERHDWPAVEDLELDGGLDSDAGAAAGFALRGAVGSGAGPRDWAVPEETGDGAGTDGDSDGEEEEEEEEHFVPPAPPPLPETDMTTKFAWLAAIGGPLLLITMVAVRGEISAWVAVVGVGGFLGGFVTLVARMKERGDDDDQSGGAVV